jgi:hypothetical protein
MGVSEVAFQTKWARYLAVSGSCSKRIREAVEDGEDNLLEHVSTPNVVADMVDIIEALGEWREKEAARLLTSRKYRERSTNDQSVLGNIKEAWKEDEIIEKTKWLKGEEKLLYWGLSYGTLLGATFAALQPHRVGRLLLDGVVDGEDYYSLEFASNLQDTEAVSPFSRPYTKLILNP